MMPSGTISAQIVQMWHCSSVDCPNEGHTCWIDKEDVHHKIMGEDMAVWAKSILSKEANYQKPPLTIISIPQNPEGKNGRKNHGVKHIKTLEAESKGKDKFHFSLSLPSFTGFPTKQSNSVAHSSVGDISLAGSRPKFTRWIRL